jgi:hypothetical protein
MRGAADAEGEPTRDAWIGGVLLADAIAILKGR